MKCQFCNTNESDRIFYTNYMGALYQIPVCEGCLHRMWQQAVAAGQAEAFRNYAGWWPGRPEPRRLGERAFPDEAAEDLKRKRQLCEESVPWIVDNVNRNIWMDFFIHIRNPPEHIL